MLWDCVFFFHCLLHNPTFSCDSTSLKSIITRLFTCWPHLQIIELSSKVLLLADVGEGAQCTCEPWRRHCSLMLQSTHWVFSLFLLHRQKEIVHWFLRQYRFCMAMSINWLVSLITRGTPYRKSINLMLFVVDANHRCRWKLLASVTHGRFLMVYSA